VIGTAALAITVSRRAEAQPLAPASAVVAPAAAVWSPAPTVAQRSDPLVFTGLSMATLASLGLIGIPLAQSTKRSTALPGWGLVGAGVGLGIVAVPTILVGALSSTPPVGVRGSEGMLTSGVWLAGMGSGLVGLFIGQLKASKGDFKDTPVALPFAAAGGAALLASIPLVVFGALPSTTRGPRPYRLRSTGRLYSGIVLSTAGIGLLGSSTFAAMWLGLSHAHEDEAVIAGFTGVVVGTGLLAAGISLWATGSKEVVATPPPQLSFGPGSLQLSGTF
jgi:hypothetical protein